MSDDILEAPSERLVWTERFGALTLDTGFSRSLVSTCTNAPYTDLMSLLEHARAILGAHGAGGQYHAYHSGLDGDLVVTSAALFLWRGQAFEPVSELTDAQEQCLREDAALRDVAGILEAQGIEASFPAMQQAIEVAGHRPEITQFLGPLMRIGKYSLAGGIIDARLEVAPDDVVALLEDAQITMNLVVQRQWAPDQLASAEQCLEDVLRLQPDNLRARLMWCDLPRYGGDPRASVPRFEALLEQAPDCDPAHYNIAVISLPHDAERALAHFERGATLAPEDADYPLGCARALLALGRHTDARAALERARQLAPEHPRIAQIEAELGR